MFPSCSDDRGFCRAGLVAPFPFRRPSGSEGSKQRTAWKGVGDGEIQLNTVETCQDMKDVKAERRRHGDTCSFAQRS